jgi:hypothetical protein
MLLSTGFKKKMSTSLNFEAVLYDKDRLHTGLERSKGPLGRALLYINKEENI